MPSQPAVTSVDVDIIWRQFMTDYATGDRFWWWPRSIRVDPDEIIADDDEGHLWRVPFSTDGATTVTFDDPVEVRETFVPVATSATGGRQQILETYTSAPERPVATTKAASRPDPTLEVNTMSDTIALLRETVAKVLRSQDRDVPDDATDEQITELFNALTAEPAPAAEPTEPVTPAAEADKADAPDLEPALTAADDKTVTVSKQVWDTTQERLDRLEADATSRETTATKKRRDEKVAWAITTGRIAPAEKTYYRELLDIDETRTAAKLDALTASRAVPLGENGHGLESDEGNTIETTGLFPQLTTKEA